MAKIWIDVSNAPHVHFFKNIIQRLKHQYEILLTARDYGPILDLLELFRLPYIPVGKHGGKTPEGKLIESMKRIIELTDFITKEKPDLAISKCSVELSRVAFGLAIPAINITDNDKSLAVNKLTFPLTTKIIAPKAITEDALIECGASPAKIAQFYGVCEMAHISEFTPNPRVLDELEIDNIKPILVIRFEPVLAAYLEKASPLFNVLKLLQEEIQNGQFILFPRTQEQAELARKIIKNAIIPKRAVDTLSLLSYASLIIGAGGTMCREASILGCPTISCYPEELLAVDKFLINLGLMFHSTNPIEITKLALDLIRNSNKQKQLVRKIISTFDNPSEIVINEVRNQS
ncbi:MAG: DUF354 domain-containing protein [Euryarchaeota archaeon]|nr:DUF354 domain-containing protein [Euryarchaeota archaeon]